TPLYRRLQSSRAFAVWMGTVLRPEQTLNDVAELDIATASYAIRGFPSPIGAHGRPRIPRPTSSPAPGIIAVADDRRSTTKGEVWGWDPAFPDDRRGRLGARAWIRRLAQRDRCAHIPLAGSAVRGQATDARAGRPMGRLGAHRLHRHSGPSSDHRADPRGRHRPARWLRLRSVARVSLLDDRPDDRLARCLLGRPPARRDLRAGNGAAGVAAHELPRRGRGSDS